MKLSSYEVEHIAKIRALSPECMVLLKSDGTFPLEAPGQIALYGNGARRTIKGGTGSGDVNVRHYVTVEEGLRNAGFTITTGEWLDGYDAVWAEADRAFKAGIKSRIAAEGITAIMLGIGAVMTEPDYDLPMTGEGDTAVYVLTRVSGEGSDRSPIPGDLQLTSTEIRDILQLQKQYDRFLLVLNVGGVVDLTPVQEAVSNILLLSQTGIAIGDAFADVLLGKAYPSGKLASTWAKWEDYCHVGDFGDRSETRYQEGVYVGYRYFDSVGKEPLFHFGYGLGYTQFEITATDARTVGSEVTISAAVKNTGRHPGKEVVQAYVSVPAGKLDQPYQVLAAFEKTGELAPGETQEVSLAFSLEELASFDAETACSILEKGRYLIRLGNSSRNTVPCAVVELDGDAIVHKLSHAGGTPDFTDWKPERSVPISVPDHVPVLPVRASDIQEKLSGAPALDPAALALAKRMTDSELAYLCIGGFREDGSKSVIGNAGLQVAGAAGETTENFLDRGIPSLIMADGPAGLRLSREYGVDEQGVYSLDQGAFLDIRELLPDEMIAYLGLHAEKPQRGGEIFQQYCTAIPVGTALAQSWDPAVCEACGDLVGEEMERFGIHLWLAPALNIHRMPLCGRNFEYYSEDPLISGKMAAGITRGTQKHPGCGVAVKHFCCNNQETNRMHSNSQVSQRALRDIYLRGFQIAITEADPATVMSSYNLLNGEHTAHREDLMETVLRSEWGYTGIVMSDWVSGNINHPDDQYPGAVASGSIKAGNDIMMPGGPRDHQDLMQALGARDVPYPLCRADLEKCGARMIALAQRLANQRAATTAQRSK